jgi:hypothetical protein
MVLFMKGLNKSDNLRKIIKMLMSMLLNTEPLKNN